MVVTHSIAINMSINTNKENLVAMSTLRAKIKYDDQPIVPLYGMSAFDDILNVTTLCTDSYRYHIC